MSTTLSATERSGSAPAPCRQYGVETRGGKWSSVVIADSWFGSVTTAYEHARRKVHFIGAVKTAHSGFPKSYLEELLKPMPSGVCCILETDVNGVQLQAIGYKYNRKKVLLFVCTKGAGPTDFGAPYVAHFCDEFENLCSRNIDRPGVVSRYFWGAPVIDNHNQQRQHDLGLEDRWPTKNPWFRLATTMIGINTVDSLKAVRHHAPPGHSYSTIELSQFSDNLAFAMIHNQEDDPRDGYSKRRAKRAATASGIPVKDNKKARLVTKHYLLPMPSEERIFQSGKKKGQKYMYRMQKKCKCPGCSRGKASFYCAACSDAELGHYHTIHKEGGCLAGHIKAMQEEDGAEQHC